MTLGFGSRPQDLDGEDFRILSMLSSDTRVKEDSVFLVELGLVTEEGPWWQSGNTLASHLCGRGSIPVMAVSGKAGSCLPLVGSLQYRTLANYMYWFPLPFQLPVVI